ncbi:glucosyl transferase [Thioclava dalianensis]|uniref:Glucosyl transferase n=1 Tax=Thioclava dalianensis TaxID=1185766 RepID=A0A074U932_9RHOB|nr:glycosyltransferase family 2 protein [Thioclava dalianensis]KEP71187.1 glucosyl transferase [Thioclava dalianensis]SFN23135.1 Glycosyl transferase family 2 [Thioclava dalianensis]
MPYASIVVPTFNSSATLGETLDALRTQNFRDLEIIVVNDGSTDDSVEIAQRHAARDGRVRIVEQPNRGLAGARNSGIAAARGAVIGFCDADDRWMPGKLAAHVAHLRAAPLVGLSYSGSVLIDQAGKPFGHAQKPRLRDVTTAHVFKRNPVGNGSAPVFRREALEAIAWRPAFETQRDWVFDETFRQSEDIECWLRFGLSTDWLIEGVPGLLTEYRVNATGLSARTEAQLASWERMVSKLRPRDPAFFARHEGAARAYQLRYLARRAISSGDADTACTYIDRALSSSRLPLREEPLRTGTTWLASRLLRHLGDAPIRAVRNMRAARG